METETRSAPAMRASWLASWHEGSMKHLHQRIRDDIEAKIMSGEWAPGHRIPFEHELMAEYGCSRMTVNKVLSTLAVNGLITRRRRAGSVVAEPSTRQAVWKCPRTRPSSVSVEGST